MPALNNIRMDPEDDEWEDLNDNPDALLAAHMLGYQECKEKARAQIEHLRELIAMRLELDELNSYWLEIFPAAGTEIAMQNNKDSRFELRQCLNNAMRKTLEE